MFKHYDIKIFGDVQEVFFRYSAAEKAEELGLSGFASNENDGSVYMEVEGEEEPLNKFIEWCEKGPRLARVERREIREGSFKNLKRFTIKR